MCNSETLKGVLKLSHPQSQELAFLYGTILTDGRDESEESSHMCVFADKEVLINLPSTSSLMLS
jgi:trans-L-3-hydroxyproline dehydratase